MTSKSESSPETTSTPGAAKTEAPQAAKTEAPQAAKTEAPQAAKTEAPQAAKTEASQPPRTAQRAEAPRAELPRFPMPWELPLFGQEAFTRGQEMFARGQEVFAQMMHEQISRTQKVMDGLAGYEAVAVDRARTAVTDLSRLAIDTLDYCAKLSAEWRKIAFETSRRAADQVSPRA